MPRDGGIVAAATSEHERWRLIAAALATHLFVTGLLVFARLEGPGEDFPSYYYAAKVLAGGGNPYDTAALQAASTLPQTIHPFLYPPPFLLISGWLPSLAPWPAYALWYWLGVALALAVAALLYRMWRGMHASLPLVIVVLLTALSAIPVNHQLGQANSLVIALALAGVWLAQSGRGQGAELAGGALVGAATAFKLSPVLILAWWALHRRGWRVAGGLLAGGLLLLASMLTIPAEVHLSFYTEVLPGLGSGAYSGLTVPIDIFGNHSFAQVYDRWWPTADAALSATAHRAATATVLLMLLATAWRCRRRPTDPWTDAAQLSLVCGVSMMVPSYVFEHHLIWLFPGVTLVSVAIAAGRLRGLAAISGALAIGLLALPLTAMRQLAMRLIDVSPRSVTILDDSKMAAVGLILALCATLCSNKT